MRITALSSLIVLAATPAFAQEIRIADLRAHLYLERTGKLSDDVLALQRPNLTDIPRGEGVFGEPANTVVINVGLAGAPNTQPRHASAIVNIITTNRTGQRKTETRPLMGFVFGPDGRLNRPIVLDNITCSKVEVEVKTRGGVRRAALDFTCTEPKAADAGDSSKPARQAETRR
jgi:hypothetical protein